MERYKSSPQDDRVIGDPHADLLERVSALKRLAFDQLYDFEALFSTFLSDPSSDLRGEAAKALLGMWCRPKYLEAGIKLLQTDPSWIVRSEAAFALASYVRQTNDQRERVVRELVRCVQNDPDSDVQAHCYQQLLRLLSDRDYLDIPDDFDRERDVDWELLKPYLDDPSAH